MSAIKAGDYVEHEGAICLVTERYARRCIIQPVAGGALMDVDAFDLSGPLPAGFQPMSSAQKVHMQKLQLFAADHGVVVGWWDAEIENFWSKRQHPDNPPIPTYGDWCCDEAGAIGDGDKRMICGFTPKAWGTL